ncbi:MAG: hypothetical protein V4439_02080 [Patescibacteria group bacterium]
MQKNIKKIILGLIFILPLCAPLSSFALSNKDLVVTSTASGVTDVSATFSGSIDMDNTDTNVRLGYFRYATLDKPPIFCNDIYGSNMFSTNDANLGNSGSATFSKTVSNLTPGSTYYYCAVVSDINQNIINYGGPVKFTTRSTVQATIQTKQPIILDSTSADLNGFYNTNVVAKTWFEYRKTGDTAWIKTDTEAHIPNTTSHYVSGEIKFSLTGATTDTQYEYRAGIQDNDQGSPTFGKNIYGNVVTFYLNSPVNVNTGTFDDGVSYDQMPDFSWDNGTTSSNNNLGTPITGGGNGTGGTGTNGSGTGTGSGSGSGTGTGTGSTGSTGTGTNGSGTNGTNGGTLGTGSNGSSGGIVTFSGSGTAGQGIFGPSTNIEYGNSTGTGSGSGSGTNSGAVIGSAEINAKITAYQQANIKYKTLKDNIIPAIANFTSLLTDAAGGINPFDVKYSSETFTQFKNQLSDKQKPIFDSAFQSLITKINGLLDIGGNQIPADLRDKAKLLLDPNTSMGTIKSILDKFSQEGGIVLTNQEKLTELALTAAEAAKPGSTAGSLSSGTGSGINGGPNGTGTGAGIGSGTGTSSGIGNGAGSSNGTSSGTGTGASASTITSTIKAPEIGDIRKPISDAIVRTGEGVETVFARQIIAYPQLAKLYGYTAGSNLKVFAGELAHTFAKLFGYYSGGGREIRVLPANIAAYELGMKDNKLAVYEYYGNKIENIATVAPILKNALGYEYYFIKK